MHSYDTIAQNILLNTQKYLPYTLSALMPERTKAVGVSYTLCMYILCYAACVFVQELVVIMEQQVSFTIAC